MIKVQGTSLDFFPPGDLQKVRDLDYFDGPLISHFRHRRGDDYLYYWCDCDERANRWMAMRVSETNIIRLMNGFVPLDYVIPGECQDEFVYFVDLDGDGAFVKGTMTPLQFVPKSYTPNKGAYLDYEAPKDERSYPVLIERALSIDQLREFPTKYVQAYAFIYMLSVLRAHRFQGYPWIGGFSSMHFYKWLVGRIPGEQRPRVASLRYSSPGFVRFSLHRPTAVEVAGCIEKFAPLHSRAEQAFKSLRNYVSENKLNQLRKRVKDPLDPQWQVHDAELLRRASKLASEAGIPDFDAIKSAAPSIFEAARITYSFCLRIREITTLVRNGHIKLPR